MRFICIIFLSCTSVLWSQSSPYSKEVTSLYEKGQEAFASHQDELAKDYFTQCIDLDKNCFEAYLGLGQLDTRSGNYSAGLIQFEKAEQLRPYDPQLLGLTGYAHYMTGDYEKAYADFSSARVLGGNYALCSYYLGLIEYKNSDYRQALKSLDEAISSAPDQVNFINKRGLVYLELEDTAQAITDFKQALKLAPNNAAGNLMMARALFNEKEEALSYLNKGLELADDEQKTTAFLLFGAYYLNHNLPDSAAYYYNQAYQLDATDPLTLAGQAAVAIELENYEGAIAKCTQAIAQNDQLKEAYLNRGIALEMTRDVEGACADWEKAFILGSQRATNYLNSSTCNE